METYLIDTLIDHKTGSRVRIHDGETNLITVGFPQLVSALLIGDTAVGGPLTWWAVGEGEGDAWDDLSTSQLREKSSFSRTSLYHEISRKSVTTVFIDETDTQVPNPTGRIEIRATFGPTVAGELREFGIFGGANASSATGTGIMIDHKSHKVVNLNNTPGQQQSLSRAIRITL